MLFSVFFLSFFLFHFSVEICTAFSSMERSAIAWNLHRMVSTRVPSFCLRKFDSRWTIRALRNFSRRVTSTRLAANDVTVSPSLSDTRWYWNTAARQIVAAWMVNAPSTTQFVLNKRCRSRAQPCLKHWKCQPFLPPSSSFSFPLTKIVQSRQTYKNN